MKSDALTIRYNGITNVIMSDVGVSVPFLQGDPAPKISKFPAVWDTGATGTVITQKVVDELGLKPIDIVMASSASTTEQAEVYLINLLLPSNVMIPGVRVIKMNIANSDILIGMDIIALGDFSITNHMGKTCMSFRVPSSHEIDYVQEVQVAGLSRHERRAAARQKNKK